LLQRRRTPQRHCQTRAYKPEITRFKGLGEISPEEFGLFIGKDIRLDPVILRKPILKAYWNTLWVKTPQPASMHIIQNLRVEKDDETVNPIIVADEDEVLPVAVYDLEYYVIPNLFRDPTCKEANAQFLLCM
jgi:hypothetical protein